VWELLLAVVFDKNTERWNAMPKNWLGNLDPECLTGVGMASARAFLIQGCACAQCVQRHTPTPLKGV
jgi:hypothetical protein